VKEEGIFEGAEIVDIGFFNKKGGEHRKSNSGDPIDI